MNIVAAYFDRIHQTCDTPAVPASTQSVEEAA